MARGGGLESQVQGIVHALEQGALAVWVRRLVLVGLLLSLALLYLVVEFRGLSQPRGMEQAEIARELATGNGFSTKTIRPLAIWQLRSGGRAVPKATFADTYHAPLPSAIQSIPFFFLKNKMRMSPQEVVYLGDRVVAAVSIGFFVLALLVAYLTAATLFDRRLAALGTGLLMVCDLFWQFSMSGLPQMLMLFLFQCATFTLVRAVKARNEAHPVGVWLALTGFFFGLLALSHALTISLFLGALVFVFFYFRPRVVAVALVAGFFFLIYSPWLVRNYAVCGSPFGIGIYSVLEGVKGSEDMWMRSLNPTFADITPGSLRGKLQENLFGQFDRLYQLLGWSVIAPVFFLSLLHLFHGKIRSDFRWFLMTAWVFAVFGMTLFGQATKDISPNQLHILFVPMFTYYGLAFVLILWSRLPVDYRVIRIGFLSLIYLACGLPMIMALLPGGATNRVQWPPYVPPFIAILGDWIEPREIIVSDMPWAVAWYADRKTLWLPSNPAQFIEVADYNQLGGPVVALYMTPITGRLEFFSQIVRGEYKDWAPFILRSPNLQQFPLKAATALPIDNECILFSDRQRWNPEETKADREKLTGEKTPEEPAPAPPGQPTPAAPAAPAAP